MDSMQFSTNRDGLSGFVSWSADCDLVSTNWIANKVLGLFPEEKNNVISKHRTWFLECDYQCEDLQEQ